MVYSFVIMKGNNESEVQPNGLKPHHKDSGVLLQMLKT